MKFGHKTITTTYALVWFCQFRFGEIPRSGRSIKENVANVMETVESDL